MTLNQLLDFRVLTRAKCEQECNCPDFIQFGVPSISVQSETAFDLVSGWRRSDHICLSHPAPQLISGLVRPGPFQSTGPSSLYVFSFVQVNIHPILLSLCRLEGSNLSIWILLQLTHLTVWTFLFCLAGCQLVVVCSILPHPTTSHGGQRRPPRPAFSPCLSELGREERARCAGQKAGVRTAIGHPWSCNAKPSKWAPGQAIKWGWDVVHTKVAGTPIGHLTQCQGTPYTWERRP